MPIGYGHDGVEGGDDTDRNCDASIEDDASAGPAPQSDTKIKTVAAVRVAISGWSKRQKEKHQFLKSNSNKTLLPLRHGLNRRLDRDRNLLWAAAADVSSFQSRTFSRQHC